MKKLILVFVLVFVLVFAIPVMAGPFGFQMGMSIEYISKNVHLRPADEAGWYSSKGALVEGLIFQEYKMLITKKHGLCMIIAATKNKKISPSGEELKKDFYEIMDEFNGKYGVGQVFDYVREGSAFRAPDKWAAAVRKSDRKLEAIWLDDLYLSEDYLIRVKLDAIVLDGDVGAVGVVYEYKNYRECIKSMRDSSF